VARQQRCNNHNTDDAGQDENNPNKAFANNAQTDNTSTKVVEEEGEMVVSIHLVLFYFIKPFYTTFEYIVFTSTQGQQLYR
jgi:hypothetical protein